MGPVRDEAESTRPFRFQLACFLIHSVVIWAIDISPDHDCCWATDPDNDQGSSLSMNPYGCVTYMDWPHLHSSKAQVTGGNLDRGHQHWLRWYQEPQTPIQTLAVIGPWDPDKIPGSSPGPDNTMAPGTIWPSDTNITTGYSLDSKHLHDLWWRHRPQTWQTMTVIGPWSQTWSLASA